MVTKRSLKGHEVPELHIGEVFEEFYRLESILNKSDQKSYIIIRLVTIIDQFCRSVVRHKLYGSSNDSLGTIELEAPFIDNLIGAIMENKRVSKEDIIAASYKFQNTAAIQKEFKNAFQGLDRNDYDELFKIRHRLVHTINQSPPLETAKYYYLAEKLMKNIVEMHDSGNNFYRLKVFALQKLKNYDALVRCYNDANAHYGKKIKKNPKNLEVLDEWGYVLWRLEKHKESIRCYDKIIKLDQSNDFAYEMKASVLGDLKDRAGAIECYDKIIAMYPDDPVGYYNQGIQLYEFGEYKTAIKFFNTAIKLDKNMSDAYYMKGKSLQMLKKYNKSIDFFNTYMQQQKESEDPNVFLDFGLSLQKNGDSVKAIEYLVKSLFLFERSEFYHTHKDYYSGMAWQGLQVHNMAIVYFKKVLDSEPDYNEARLAMGESLLEMGEHTDAIQCFDTVLQTEPENRNAQGGKKAALAQSTIYTAE